MPIFMGNLDIIVKRHSPRLEHRLSSRLAQNMAILFSHTSSTAFWQPHLPPQSQSPQTWRWLAPGSIRRRDNEPPMPAIRVSDESRRWVFPRKSCTIPAPLFVQESSIENQQWKLRRRSVTASAHVQHVRSVTSAVNTVLPTLTPTIPPSPPPLKLRSTSDAPAPHVRIFPATRTGPLR